MVGLRRELLRIPTVGSPLPALDIPACAVAIGPESREIRAATGLEILRLDQSGNVILRRRLAKPSSQSWVAAF